MRVRADGAHLFEDLLCALDDILREEAPRLFDELWVLCQRSNLTPTIQNLISDDFSRRILPLSNTHLAIVRDRRLVEALLLRVPDVTRDDAVEGQAVVLVAETAAVLLSLDGELAADCVLDVPDGGVERVDCESAHGGRGREETDTGTGDGGGKETTEGHLSARRCPIRCH